MGINQSLLKRLKSPPVFFKILLGALLIYLICTVIELIRMGIFKLIRYKKLLKGIDNVFEKWVLMEKDNNPEGVK